MYESDTDLIRFFKSRKSKNTRDHASIILEFLSSHKNKGRWIRLKEIKDALVSPDKIKDPTAFQRTLNDLATAGILEKKVDESWQEGGRKPVFFKYMREFNPVSFLPREQLEKMIIAAKWQRDAELEIPSSMGHEELSDVMTEMDEEYPGYQEKLNIIREMLEEMGFENPDEAIIRKYMKELR